MYTTSFEVTTIRRGKTLKFQSKSITFDENNVSNIDYGYIPMTNSKGRELNGSIYTIYHQMMPKSGDKLVDLHSGEEYEIGKISGFLNYEAELLYQGAPVGKIKFEDYYKD